jgi:hypothetical protein
MAPSLNVYTTGLEEKEEEGEVKGCETLDTHLGS